MLIDSVFSTFTEIPFAEDRPLIPRREIIRAMNAIEEVAVAAQMKILEAETEQLLREAAPYLENPNLEKIIALDWSAGVKLQRPMVGVWEAGWQAGGEQMLAEARAAIPAAAMKEVEASFSLFSFRSYALPSDVLSALRSLIRLRPGTLTNTAAEQAVLRRAIQLAGNFSRDQLGRLKTHLISAISPDIQGVIIDRQELLTRIENTLNVGRVRSQMIARTELTGAYNTARVQTANQSSLVSHLRFLAIGDDRTTDICASRNGMLIPIDDTEAIAANKPSLHVACRSTLSPVMPRVNPLHAQWVADPDRDYRRRNLAALPDGWNGITTPPPPQPQPPVAPGEFPSSLDRLQRVRSLGGSTGAILMRDPDTGQQFVLKRGSSSGHIREEMAADAAYQALGVPVPNFREYQDADGNPVKLAEFINGRSLSEVFEGENQVEIDQIKTQLKQNFAADALLGNWDVIGLELDNILVDADGTAWRIDNGGALRYRAQGRLKGNDWDEYPTDLWSLRDSEINRQSAEVFEGIEHRNLVNQLEDLVSRETDLLNALPEELHSTIQGRLREMNHLVDVSQVLLNDQWNDDYVDGFARHTLGLRATGLIDRLPNELNQKGNSTTVEDENGKPFDNLRGAGSRMFTVMNYINSSGGDYEVVRDWMDGQAVDSWSNESKAYKWFLASSRGVDIRQGYFWPDDSEVARSHYLNFSEEAGGEVVYTNTFQAFHAFNHELLLRTRITNSDPESRTITLLRIEARAVMVMNSLNVGDRNIIMRRGAAESTSIYEGEGIHVHGTENTVQRVPYHRIFGNYLYERTPGKADEVFAGDRENEFVAMLDGIPFDYVKPDPEVDEEDLSDLGSLFN